MGTKSNNRFKGTKYEKTAAAFLHKFMQYELVEMNFRCRQGEIDIIANDGSVLCFIEVKYRKDSSCGLPEEAVDKRKQKKIIMVSEYYRITHNISESRQIRYDVVSILGDRIKVIKNAFGG